jgi:hypothetical protein
VTTGSRPLSARKPYRDNVSHPNHPIQSKKRDSLHPSRCRRRPQSRSSTRPLALSTCHDYMEMLSQLAGDRLKCGRGDPGRRDSRSGNLLHGGRAITAGLDFSTSRLPRSPARSFRRQSAVCRPRPLPANDLRVSSPSDFKAGLVRTSHPQLCGCRRE